MAIENKDRMGSLVSFVGNYVKENGGNGCQSYMLKAKGFTDKEIKLAVDSLLIESKRGKGGGLFLYGEKPEAQDREASLREEAFALLQKAYDTGTLDRAEIGALLLKREEEKERRSAAKKADKEDSEDSKAA